MKIKATFTLMVILMMCVGLIQMLPAQVGRGKGRLTGEVRDQAGQPIAGAKIEALFEDEVTKLQTTSDKKGKWVIMGLGSGKYRVTITAQGYMPRNELVHVKQLSRNQPMILTLKPAEKIVASKDLMVFLEAGNKAFKEKKYDEAITNYQKLLDEHPKLYQVKYKIADSYKEKGEHDRALKMYEEVVDAAKAAKDINVAGKGLGAIGAIYLKNNDVEKAQSYFKQSVDLNPQDEILAYNVGEINFGNNNIDEAIKYFELAAKIKPQWAEPLMKIAYCYLNKGDNQNAVKYLKQVVAIDPNSESGKIAQDIINSLQ